MNIVGSPYLWISHPHVWRADCIWITFSFSFHPSTLRLFPGLACSHNAAVNMGVHIYLFKIIILFPLDIYLEVGLLDHTVVLFLIF